MVPQKNGNPEKRIPDQGNLKFYSLLLIVFLLLVLAAALSVPFVYESQTLWYKVGADKTMLRTGQIFGLLAAVLIFVQVLLASRGKLLKELFGLAALLRWHRANGIVVAFLVVGHVTLILVPEGLTNLPIGFKYWPEMVGGLLLWVILVMAISSHFRERLALNYQKWKVIHKFLGYSSLLLLSVHVLFVSESFRQPVPKAAFFTVVIGVIIGIFLSKKSVKAKVHTDKS